jgi:uncharacterized protein (TIGR02001 family)
MHKQSRAMAIWAGIGLLLITAGGRAAEVSANIGWMSDYIFRGIHQSYSSINGGVDLSHRGLSLGTWAADVDDGAEVDLYLGYTGTLRAISYGIGATGYFYTGGFDDTYQEINVSAGYRFLTLEAAFGDYANFDGPSQEYSFYSITAAYAGIFGTAGSFGRDFGGEFFELGYQREILGIDAQLRWVHSSRELLGDKSDDKIAFTIGKSFSFLD